MKPLTNEQYIESILIGNILISPETYPIAADIVKPTDFSIDSAFKIWLSIASNWSASDNSDLQAKVYMSLDNDSDKKWFFEATGDIVPMRSSVKGLAEQVSAMSKMRRIRSKLVEITSRASKPDVKSDWILEDILSIYRTESGSVDEDVSISSVVERFSATQEKNSIKGCVGLRTGFDLMQNDYIVYQPGHLWVIGAWTSTGKSAFMIEAVCRFFLENDGGKVAIFSTEMTEDQNVARIIANRTGVNANVILSGNMLQKHKEITDSEKKWLAGKNLYIYTKTRNIDEIASQCRKLKHSGGVDLVYVDFIQNTFKTGYSDQYSMMSQIAKDLQALAHDVGCTIICLSQLPNHAGREDTGILEFKGAGEIAAACDIGVLMKRAKEDKSKILFDIRKNRHGACAKYIMQFDNNWTRIVEREAV